MIADEDLLAYIRPSTDDDLDTLRRLERAAVAAVQKRTGVYYGVESEITEILHWRGWPMALANEPVGGVIESLESWDGSAWSVVTASSYYIDTRFIYWQTGMTVWTPLSMPTRYRATYDAGFPDLGGDSIEAPEDVKQAVLLLVGHWFENREAVVVGDSHSGELPLGVSALLSAHARVAV